MRRRLRRRPAPWKDPTPKSTIWQAPGFTTRGLYVELLLPCGMRGSAWKGGYRPRSYREPALASLRAPAERGGAERPGDGCPCVGAEEICGAPPLLSEGRNEGEHRGNHDGGSAGCARHGLDLLIPGRWGRRRCSGCLGRPQHRGRSSCCPVGGL